MFRVLRSLLLGTTAIFNCGFVYLSGDGAKLPATAESPVIRFVWSGEALRFTGKDTYMGGKFEETSDEELTRAIFEYALAQWTTIRGSFLILELDVGDAALDSKDLQNSILITNDCERTQATHPTISGDRKMIEDCDIEICVSEVDAHWFMSSMTHEFGHCAGLGHPHSNYQSIMSYSNGGKIDKPGLDDIAGIVSLYPDPAFPNAEVKSVVNCGLIAGVDNRSVVPSWILLFAPLLLVPLFSRKA